jgi:predicted aldo/keto reductase-like oxidoreductase
MLFGEHLKNDSTSQHSEIARRIQTPGGAMITRRFGRTELAMPVFSCGGMRYQQSWKDEPGEAIDPANQANLEATIGRALELGINHIETARGYGSSEAQLGRILPRLPREKLIVQTKVAPQETGEKFLEVFNTSMERLQLEYVDLLSLHGINTPELLASSLKPGGSLEAARQLQREGRVRFVGFSTHAPCSVILQAIRTGEFDYLNLHWYWIFQENWPAIEEAQMQDMGVFIISPNDKGGKLYEPPEKLSRLCEPLHPMAFNDLWCLSHPEVHTLSLGASRPSDFDTHIEALQSIKAPTKPWEVIDCRLTTEMRNVLGVDWMERCFDGVPEWETLPGEINIRMILRLWNLDEALGMRVYAKMRYNLLGQGGHWFPGKNAEAFDEKSLLAALPDYPFKDRIPAILHEAHARWFDKPAERLSKSSD